MKFPEPSQSDVSASSLDDVLRQVEQRYQEIRGRLATLPIDEAVKNMEGEIDAFAMESSRVA